MPRYLISFDAHAMDHIPDDDMPAVAKAHLDPHLRRLRESQDAPDKGVALLALEPRLVRPGAIGDRLVVDEVLSLLGVRQGLPLRRLLRLLRLRRR